MTSKAGLLDNCGICSARLPLRQAEPGETAEDWQCAGCGTFYSAILREDAPGELRRNVKRADFELSESKSDANSLRPVGAARNAMPAGLGVTSRLETDVTRHLDMDIEDGTALRVEPQQNPFAMGKTIHGVSAYPDKVFRRQFLQHRANAGRTQGIYTAMLAGRTIPLSETEDLGAVLLDLHREDADLQLCLSLNSNEGEYPSNQGLRTAMVAMSIAASLGYDEPTILKLCHGCLLHDLGMQSLPEVGFDSSRVFTAHDYANIASHPVHAFELLRRHLDAMPMEVRMVAYQMHERCDGRGYPRGRTGDQIHALAKIAAVADAFVALVSPRPHRDALMPYYAIEKLIHDTKDGLYDANAVRGLLRSVSLFPIGSTVLIGDELIGRVLRTNPDQYDRPVVEIKMRSKPSADPLVFDLTKYQDLAIKPVPAEQVWDVSV